MFSSSIAKNSDVERIKRELDCDFKIVTTYHIIENEAADDPESYLENMVESNMDESYDFAIFATGTNDISNLNV